MQAWAKRELTNGQALRQPAPLFKKLDESVIEEEYARLEGWAEAGNQQVRESQGARHWEKPCAKCCWSINTKA